MRAKGWSDRQIKATIASSDKMEAQRRRSRFFFCLGHPTDFGDGPNWSEERIAGPDFVLLMAGAPMVWKGRGKPKHTYSGLDGQLLTAYRIAECALKGVTDKTGVPVLERCRSVAVVRRFFVSG